MGFPEATTMVYCGRRYEKEHILTSISKITKVEMYRGLVAELPDWYQFPEDPAIRPLLDDSPIFLATETTGEFLSVCTNAGLFDPPVLQATRDLLIVQYADLVRVIADEIDADAAWLAPFGKTDVWRPLIKGWSKGESVILPPTTYGFALFGCRTNTGFRLIVQRQEATANG